MAERFVKARNGSELRQQTAPPSTQPPYQEQEQPRLGRTDRFALAAGAKIPRRRGGRSSVAGPAPPPPPLFDQTLPTTALEQAPAQGAFDDSVPDEFEDTKSDLQYNGYDLGTGVEPTDEEGSHPQDRGSRYQQVQTGFRHPTRTVHPSKLFQHTLQHQPSRSPLVNQDLPQQQNGLVQQQPFGIAGRFESTEQWQQQIPHHGGNEFGQQIGASNLQGHSSDPAYAEYCQQQDMGRSEGDEDLANESSSESDLPEQYNSVEDHGMQDVRDGGLEPRTDGAESGASTVTPRAEIQRVIEARKKNPDRVKLDHDDETLEGMTYADLKKEEWDAQNGGQKRPNPSQTQNAEFSFEDYFHHVVKEEAAEEQVEFFETLSMDQFEQAGDLFISKFSDLMQQMTAARKNKRKIVSDFETEIELRENAVRGKCENLEKQFKDMRAGGEGVLRGKV